MKKLLIALPFVATASWAGTTLYSGAQTRDAYDTLLAQLDALSTLAVSSESFTSGFAHSSAVTAVRTSDAPDGETLFRLRHRIEHTPFSIGGDGARVGAARIVTTLLTDGMDERSAQLLAAFEGGEPFVLESNIGFDRRAANVLHVAPFADARDTGSLSFDGARYDIALDPEGRVTAAGEIGAFELLTTATGTATRVVVAPGTDRWALERVAEGFYTGTQTLALGTLGIVVGGETVVELAGAGLEASSAYENGLASSEMTFAVERILSPMPLPLDSLSFGTRVAGLDVAALQTHAARINALYTVDAQDADPTELLGLVGELYGAMIVPGASLDYTLAASNAGGDVAASAGIVFEGDGSTSGHAAMTSVGELLRALRMTATLDADADAVAMTPAAMFLAGDALAPWIVSDGTSYRSDIAVDDLIVDINGNPLSLELMLGEALAMPLDAALPALMPGGPRD